MTGRHRKGGAFDRGKGGRSRENEPLARLEYTGEDGGLVSEAVFTQLDLNERKAALEARGFKCHVERLR